MSHLRNHSLLIAILGAGLVAGNARGQGPYVRPTVNNPYAQPAFSPYLNLLRSGSSPAVNYYGLVRPQQEFRTGIQQLQQQNLALDQGLAAVDATAAGLVVTGHHSSYLTHARYFLNQGGQTLGPLRPGVGPAGAARSGQPGGSAGAGSNFGTVNRGASSALPGQTPGIPR